MAVSNNSNPRYRAGSYRYWGMGNLCAFPDVASLWSLSGYIFLAPHMARFQWICWSSA